MKIQPKSKYKYTIKRTNNPFTVRWNGLPAIKRKTILEHSLYESIFTSVFGHIILFLLIWALTFSLFYFGIAPKLFAKPKPKIQNIEFELNNSVWRKSSHNRHEQRAKVASSKSLPAAVPETKQPKAKSEFSQIFNKMTQKSKATTNKKSTQSPFATKAAKGSKKSTVPAFSMPMPNLKSVSSGLNGSKGKKHHASGFDASHSVLGDNDGGASAGKNSSGNSGFNKTATRKIISTYDISPYVNELKRSVRWNWKSPHAEGNKRVELFLRIAKDGRLIILNVKKTSENGETDDAALSAVRKCTPLNPLPAKYNKNYLDVIFTFDSNYVGSRF